MSKPSPRSTAQIRRDFLEFFAAKGHAVVPSSPLVPGNDPTLLFTNAGMVQFKDVFLGAEKRSYTRAVSSQRCVRAGGKHNDLDQVGYTARHHTFFEMLGNFSFGDYFKRDAIAYAWELLTGVWQLPAERLLVTVYHTDDEAFEIWHRDIGLPAERIIRIGDNKGAPYASDNFWQMADTGPCGPCTEIFYDHGAHIPGGPPGSPDEDGDRFIEIWNNVFMQFDRQPDGTLLPLPAPCVDTGMGLERIAAVLQHVHSNYEIDLFAHLIKAAAGLTGTEDLGNKSLRVIADHIRACAFLIADGVLPSNEGRGYVLRRIIRRAVRHGHLLGASEPFFHKMVQPLVDVMGGAYPELTKAQPFVEKALLGEEVKFRDTLNKGMLLLERALDPSVPVLRHIAGRLGWGDKYFLGFRSSSGLSFDGLYEKAEEKIGVLLSRSDDTALDLLRNATLLAKNLLENGMEEITKVLFVVRECDPENLKKSLNQFAALQSNPSVEIVEISDEQIKAHQFLSGGIIFQLYDTFGFPSDLTADICRERGFVCDLDAFEVLLEQQRERARAAGKFAGQAGLPAELVARLHATEFKGYERMDCDGCKVVALLRDGVPVERLQAGERGVVILDKTPFYAESGGQVGDAGELRAADGLRFEVEDTQKLSAIFHGHAGTLHTGSIALGDKLSARVDGARRQATVLNHSATHLLHAALRSVLGEHVSQKGSLVNAERTRFDFSHFQAVTPAQLQAIEDLVNAEIRRNAEAEVHHMGMQEAIEFGAMALFGEKYGERVRVLKMGDFSTELCGGTHVHRTGDIGVFKILSEAGIAAGVRRIEATTGSQALVAYRQAESALQQAAGLVGARGQDVLDKLAQLLERQKRLERELDAFKAEAASGQSRELADNALDLAGIKLVKARLEGLDAKALRELVDDLKGRLPDSILLLAAADGGKASFAASVNGRAQAKLKANELLAYLTTRTGGKGGGRADYAQGGGEDGEALRRALAELDGWLQSRLG